MNHRYLAVAAATLTAIALLSGCAPPDHRATSLGQRGSSAQSAAYNGTDVAFATEMIDHHEQAIAIVDGALAAGGVEPAVADLAKAIRAADESEIGVMTAWLESWNVASADAERGRTVLDGASRAGADRGTPSDVLLERMVDHQAAAIRICRHELDEGKNSVALKLAQRIIDARTAQLEQLERLLAR